MNPAAADGTTGRRRLIFLAGAHKTASSHLQARLMRSTPMLRAHGMAAVPPRIMRADLTPVAQMMRGGVSARIGHAAGRAFLDLHAPGAERVLLMDENVLGSTDRKMLLRRRKLYPWAHLRLASLAALFPGHEIEIALAVRNPASFLPSCWSESLHHGEIRPFSDYVEGIELTSLRWTALAERLRDAVPQARLTMWRYEDYGALAPRILARLVGARAAEAVAQVDRVMRPRLSAQAVEWLLGQPAPGRETLREARRRFPRTAPQEAFDPWDEATRNALDEIYRRDLRDLARLPGVNWLGLGA